MPVIRLRRAQWQPCVSAGGGVRASGVHVEREGSVSGRWQMEREGGLSARPERYRLNGGTAARVLRPGGHDIDRAGGQYPGGEPERAARRPNIEWLHEQREIAT